MDINDLIALKEHKFLSPQVKIIGGRHSGKLKEQITQAYQKGWNDCIDAIIDNAPTVCGNNPKWCENCVSKGKCASTRPQCEFTREELESWLYRIAENNFGNDLGRSCEEIIGRLDGFERFVSDLRKDGEKE